MADTDRLVGDPTSDGALMHDLASGVVKNRRDKCVPSVPRIVLTLCGKCACKRNSKQAASDAGRREKSDTCVIARENLGLNVSRSAPGL
jgi:hypothetical protein